MPTQDRPIIPSLWTLLCLATLVPLSVAGPAAAQGFHGVHSQDGLDAWAVGDGGVTWRSLDGGLSWASGQLGPSRLRDVVSLGLTVIVVGDSGKIWRSTNSGGSWSLEVVAGTPSLRAVTMPTLTDAWVVGDGGVVLHSVDGGQTWSPQASGTGQRLNAVRFVDASQGWVVGDGGVALFTTDGGTIWNPVALPTSQPLYALDCKGTRVWIGGGEGVAFKSSNAGASFSPVDLRMEYGSEVRAAWIGLPDSIYLAGGGGFIRLSPDGGDTWTYGIHAMHGQIADLWFAEGVGFAVSNKFLMPITTIDRGIRWQLPPDATMSRSWMPRQGTSASVRGSTFAINPVHRNTIYCAMGNVIYRSQDEGEIWTNLATIPQCARVNAFQVSPKDSNVFIAAVTEQPGARRLVRSDDHGQTWFTTLSRNFGEYGTPLEYDPDHPDTLYFGGDEVPSNLVPLHRSTDGGKNWEPWSNPVFRSPCDIAVVPGASNVIIVGDGITGTGRAQYFRSSDGGQSFTVMDTRPINGSEIPALSVSRQRPGMIFGTNWSTGGVQRSRDMGETWPSVMTTFAAWGTEIARDDPNVVIYGVYSGGTSYLSTDSGFAFVQVPLSGTNYAFYLRDRGLILAMQAGGIYKMRFFYNYVPQNGQSLTLASPVGGEVWPAGATRDITWNGTNIALARIEYRRDATSPWVLLAEVPGNRGRYAWTVPNDATTEALIRVSDAWDSDPEDVSSAFTITGTTVGVGQRVASSFALWQNQPNPFTRTTRIHYALPAESEVSLDVFDLQGQRVATLASGRQAAGVHEVSFGPGVTTAAGDRIGDLAVGVYFYRIRAGSFGGIRKMLIVK